jgi:hypothetical protein
MKVLLLFALSLSVATAFCQQSPIPQLLKRDTVFFEDFNVDNDTNWVDEKDKSISVKGGFFYYRVGVDTANAYHFPVPFDTSKNFEFQFRAKTPQDKKGCGIFFWGREAGESYCGNYWYFYKDGCSSIFNTSDSAGEGKTKNWYLRQRLDGEGFNIYTIRKWQHRYYIYVNNRLVKVIAKEFPCYEPRLGLGSGSSKHRQALAVFDYISVSYIE